MRIAIPVFGTRVSPRFDCAQEFLLIDIDDGTVARKERFGVGNAVPLERVRTLAGLGVEAIVCGGIDIFSAQQLAAHGIRAYSWVTGEAEDALRCFLLGELTPGTMIGPGGRCCGRWRFRGGGLRRGGPPWSQY